MTRNHLTHESGVELAPREALEVLVVRERFRIWRRGDLDAEHIRERRGFLQRTRVILLQPVGIILNLTALSALLRKLCHVHLANVGSHRIEQELESSASSPHAVAPNRTAAAASATHPW